MELIDKDKIVAEIEEALDGPAPLHDQQCSWEDGYYCGLYKAESIIDSIEAKEVDLEKEIDLVKGDYAQVDVAWNKDFDFIAKHFFELGMTVSNKA